MRVLLPPAWQCRLGIPRLPAAKPDDLASCTANSARHSAGSAFPFLTAIKVEFFVIRLQAPPRSLDRAPSPVAVSRKREYFKCPPETISDFAPAAPNFGARRPIANSQKPAIGGHFLGYRG